MDLLTRDRLARKYKRCQTLGTNDPFCRLCGKFDWWVRYELHHIAGRAYAPDVVILLCGDCHDLASDMQKEHPPLNDNLDAETAKHVKMLLGLKDLVRIADRQLGLAIQHINGWSPKPLADEGEEDA
jgi:hypothetical protein